MSDFNQGMHAVNDEKLHYNSLESLQEEKKKNQVLKGVVASLFCTVLIIMAVTIINIFVKKANSRDL